MGMLQYDYEVDDFHVTIDDLLGGGSVFVKIDQGLSEIEGKAGSLKGKYIIWRGADRVWDLLLPDAERNGIYMAICPLGAITLAEAKTKLWQLIASGRVPRVIS